MRRFHLPTSFSLLALLVPIAMGACSSVDTAPGAASGEMGEVGDEESATSGEGTGEETEGGMLPEPDAGAEPACDPWAQDCPVGEKCTHHQQDGDSATHCVPVDPEPGSAGDSCEVENGQGSGVDDCDAGLVCHYVDEQGLGVCVEVCGGTPEEPSCSDPDAMCQVCGEGCASVCVPLCDPLSPECDDGQVCAPTNDGVFVCTPGGSKDGPGVAGESCEYANECDNGYACVPGELVPGCEASFCCTNYCDLGLDKQCPEQLVCIPWDEDNAQSEYEDVGVCALP